MALIIVFQNISNLADTSDYKVDVLINEQRIAGPFLVKRHKRAKGWYKLIEQFMQQVTEKDTI